MNMKIGALAQATRTSVPTVRFYEEIGLIPRASRQSGSQRIYGASDVQRLTFIRRCREFGFSIPQVRTLTSLLDRSDGACTQTRELAQAQLIEVQSKLHELQELERSLKSFINTCDTACTSQAGSDCSVLQQLGAPLLSAAQSVADESISMFREVTRGRQ